jgi:hypothetical protein
MSHPSPAPAQGRDQRRRYTVEVVVLNGRRNAGECEFLTKIGHHVRPPPTRELVSRGSNACTSAQALNHPEDPPR